MKRFLLSSIFLGASLLITSCSDFLDTLPDNRTEIDTESKVTNLLVSAYPQVFPMMMWEMSSDNVMDNGSLYDIETQAIEDAYLWEDIKTDTDTDAPQGVWANLYMAIASANNALKAIEEMGNPASLNPQKGEALLCRAYSHFILANTFCMAYNPNTAANELGIPYATEPETTVSPVYERGSLEDTYKNIEKDILEGLPLIDDNIYTVPKYHFNKKAAYAFAARFYLFYIKEDKSNYEKVIEYADKVLGTDPTKVLRNYSSEMGIYDDPENMANAYIDAKSAANLMISVIYSSWPYIYGPYDISKRYGLARAISENELLQARGPWGDGNVLFFGAKLYGFDQKISFFKYNMYFEFTDKVNGIGYRHAVIVPFSTNETLLCRAEANVMKSQPDYNSALNDLNAWVAAAETKEGGLNADVLTVELINDFYRWLAYTPVELADDKGRTAKKKLNPFFTFESSQQENFIHCILQARRLELVHDGNRWLDIKRWGIEFSHNREDKSPITLKKDDPRRAIQLPQDVINAGLEANPR